jgi:Transposase IS200 like
MGAPRKYIRHKSVLAVTMSLEQGLILLSNPLCLSMIKSCLARSSFLYKVDICHFIVNGNHIHLIFVVIAPVDACKFVGHFKAEVAHRINAIFGWKKRTIWCEGYDSPVVLTPLRALLWISYLYANPAKDNLEDSIEKFPGLSSWKMFMKGEHKKEWKHLKRPAFEFLPKDAHNLQGYSREAARIETSTKKTHIFELKPNAWLVAFGITDPLEIQSWNKRLVNRVRALELRARKKRAKEKKLVMGKDALINQKLTLDYKSNRSGRRMWCLSEKRSVRIEFIVFLKNLLSKAREVYERWHLGDFTVSYPPGLFPPMPPRTYELLSA